MKKKVWIIETLAVEDNVRMNLALQIMRLKLER